ncbi:hypothetical protein ACFONN_05530 [Dyella humi]|uniref:Uncharacterized protein n=1 Tax=Dyella humi TaxID=1770547 RepID=A0ABW8IHA6_9GAMM
MDLFARMSLDSSIPGLVIGFGLKEKNAATGTYTVPSPDVVFLTCLAEYPDYVPSYEAVSGRINLVNHQPIERVSGSLHFVTEKKDGISFTILDAQFDIEGRN